MRGRKPDTPELKEAKGNPSRRPIKRLAVSVPALDGSVPKMLSKIGKIVWKALAPTMEQMKFQRKTDRFAFFRYRENMAAWLAVRNKMKKSWTRFGAKNALGLGR